MVEKKRRGRNGHSSRENNGEKEEKKKKREGAVRESVQKRELSPPPLRGKKVEVEKKSFTFSL
jgi:hypothetical protein